MNRTILPNAPNPASFSDVGSWQMAAFQWMQQVKTRVETDSRANTVPVGPLVVSTYTTTNTITGTDAASNFVATMVTLMQQQGLTSPNTQRTTT